MGEREETIAMRNKPRVFLSHSKLDRELIQRLYDDLRRCQVEPWLDDQEIRHGQAWLDAIFGSGIPTCDCVLVYLTPNSLQSPMVKKEIDASLIRKLRDSRISFLPYVSDEGVRDRLRPDIQALQAPIWNRDNYAEMLPRVVAEIWRGFMERNIVVATDAEKVRRLEAELELSQIKSQESGIFTKAEDQDFAYIWKTLDRWEGVTFTESKREKGEDGPTNEVRLLVRVRTVVPFLGGAGDYEHVPISVDDVLKERLLSRLPIPSVPGGQPSLDVTRRPSLREELLMLGLIDRRERPQHRNYQQEGVWAASIVFRPSLYTCVYTQKLDRFKYWLALRGELPKEIEWSTEQSASSVLP